MRDLRRTGTMTDGLRRERRGGSFARMGAVTLPILPSPDFDVTASFYRQLGSRETGRWPDEYLIRVGGRL